MATSALRAACRPSMPLIPTPMWAAWIMETSFAPSPMASRIDCFLCFLTSFTTRAFCSGDTRQQMTALHMTARSRNSFSRSFSSAYVSDLPSMTRANVSISIVPSP